MEMTMKKEIYIYIYIFLYLNYFASHQKLTQHCNSTVIKGEKKKRICSRDKLLAPDF